MILKDIVSLLANRINQPRVIEGYLRKVYAKGYEAGAKQSPWISVKERLPEEGKEVIVLYEYVSTLMVQTSFYHKQYEVWRFGDSKIIAWMPIPSFNEILEANRDVLERIKEKGD
jgi:hypothetical protein